MAFAVVVESEESTEAAAESDEEPQITPDEKLALGSWMSGQRAYFDRVDAFELEVEEVEHIFSGHPEREEPAEDFSVVANREEEEEMAPEEEVQEQHVAELVVVPTVETETSISSGQKKRGGKKKKSVSRKSAKKAATVTTTMEVEREERSVVSKETEKVEVEIRQITIDENADVAVKRVVVGRKKKGGEKKKGTAKRAPLARHDANTSMNTSVMMNASEFDLLLGQMRSAEKPPRRGELDRSSIMMNASQFEALMNESGCAAGKKTDMDTSIMMNASQFDMLLSRANESVRLSLPYGDNEETNLLNAFE